MICATVVIREVTTILQEEMAVHVENVNVQVDSVTMIGKIYMDQKKHSCASSGPTKHRRGRTNKMILVDLNQTVLSNLMQQINITKNEKVEENFLRHMILASLRSYKTKFEFRFGKMIICNDTSNYWRKDYFPNYKVNRKKSQEKSILDWNVIFELLNKIKDEIRENFPWQYISVPRCEADDIIAVLAKEYAKTEEVLIVSGDKDFLQLQRYPNISQYSPVKKGFMKEAFPNSFLKEKIIYGDPGDGIPNIASDDDTFLLGKRQGRVTADAIKWALNEAATSRYRRNFERNKYLIDFDCIPENISKSILEKKDDPPKGSEEKTIRYLQKNNLKVLLKAYGEY